MDYSYTRKSKYTKADLIDSNDLPHYINNTTYWITQDHKIIPIVKLKDDHIHQIQIMLIENSTWRQEFQSVLVEELKRRKIVELSKSKAGSILYG